MTTTTTPRPLPDGYNGARITVEGVILGAKKCYPKFGGARQWFYKWLVADDRGFKVYVSVPKFSEYPETEPGEKYKNWRGLRVQFDAKLTVSDRDGCFCFGSRPTRARFLTPLQPQPSDQ